jgi:uncharacterized protein with FMN-binding domain
MTRNHLYRSIPAAVMTGAIALGANGPLQTVHAATFAASKSLTFKGPIEQTQHGPIGASIVVKNKKIVKVGASIAPNEDGRSPFIQTHAAPILRAEVLKAQSGKVDIVSGATETSEAYIQSVDSAIKKARKAKALK